MRSLKFPNFLGFGSPEMFIASAPEADLSLSLSRIDSNQHYYFRNGNESSKLN